MEHSMLDNMNHLKTKAYDRLVSLFDDETFIEFDSYAKSEFGYSEIVTGYGKINGMPVYAFAQNSEIDGGAVSKLHMRKLKKLYDLALKTGSPIVGIYDSIGARLDEGNEVLQAYGDVLSTSNSLSGVVPRISVVLGPCIGTNGMLAASSDILIMSKSACLGIEVSGENIDSISAYNNGAVHILCDNDNECIDYAKKIISMLPSNNLSSCEVCEFSEPKTNITNKNASNINLKCKDIINACFDKDSFIEFQKGFGQAFCIGLSTLAGVSVGVVCCDRLYNDGIIDRQSCEKASRFVRFCDAFSLPIITFVNAKAFNCLSSATKLSVAYSEATTAKVCIITGEAYGSVYITLAGAGANSDVTIAWSSASISPLLPQTSMNMLWSDRLKGSSNPILDRERLIQEYKSTQASAKIAAEQVFVSDVIESENTRERLISAIDMLANKRVSKLPKKHSVI